MISIVIPLYNKARTISSTLNSVFDQSFQDFEIIIVNDGSTDSGDQVIRSLYKDSRIRIINQDNMGVSAARNNGVLAAKYEYVAFLDGDDQWLPGYLAKLKEAILLYPNAGLFCCAGFVIDNNGKYLRLASKYKEKIIEVNFFENPHVFLHTSATVVQKKVFNNTLGFPLGMKRNQDYALFFSLALLTSTIYLGFPLSIYNGGIDGQATNKSIDQMREHVVKRFNHVYSNWIKTNYKNDLFLIFMKYEVRDLIKGFLNSQNYDTINYFINNLDTRILENFSKIEIKFYQKSKWKHVGIYYIYITKVIWRLRGYPRLNYKPI